MVSPFRLALKTKMAHAICMAAEQVVRCSEGLIYYTGYSVPVLIALFVGLAMTFLATRTQFGRYVYATVATRKRQNLQVSTLNG